MPFDDRYILARIKSKIVIGIDFFFFLEFTNEVKTKS